MKKFFYRVEKGDGVITVAHRFNVPIVGLIKQNSLCKEIEEGDLLFIQSESEPLYSVKLFDTPESLAKAFNTTPSKILTDNDVDYLFYGLEIKI